MKLTRETEQPNTVANTNPVFRDLLISTEADTSCAAPQSQVLKQHNAIPESTSISTAAAAETAPAS